MIGGSKPAMTPAETPTECEACEPYMEPKMEVVPAKIRAMYTGDLVVHAQHLHFQLSEKDARIRELVAFAQSVESCQTHGCGQCQRGARAALARSEGEGA